jgi:predicted ATPase
LCRSLNDPRLLCLALMGQWRYSLVTDNLTVTAQIAQRVYSLTQEQNEPALMIGACRPLAVTFYNLGDFETARQYAIRGVQIWRSGSVQSPAEDFGTPVVGCLCYQALCELHFGEIASSDATLSEAISLAKELNDMSALAFAMWHAGCLAHLKSDPGKVELFMSDLIELSTQQNFVNFVPLGTVLRGWACSASGGTAEGISWIEGGIRDYRATGSILDLPFLLALKADALHLEDRNSDALEAIEEAEALVEISGRRNWCAELQRLRGVFLATMGADETQIEASFREAIRIAKEQKSVSLAKRAEASHAEYHSQKASGSGGHRCAL